MKNRPIRFLLGSIIGIFIFCIVIFLFMIRQMRWENEESMSKVCQMYMTEMSHQTEAHFRSVMDVRLAMAKAIIRRYPPEDVAEYGDELIEELRLAARIRDYTYVALCSEDGIHDVVYGESVKINNEGSFLESIKSGEDMLSSGVDESGNLLLLFGVNAAYPMAEGERSLALVLGIPITNLYYAMSLDTDDSLSYFHIIDKDGSFVLRDESNTSDNYFEWLLREGSYDGRTTEQAVNEMRRTVANEECNSTIVMIDGKRYNIYYEPLKRTEWALVTVMIQGPLDEAVAELGDNHLKGAFIACFSILIVLLIIYIIYFRMTLNQIRMLSESRMEAEKANKAKSEFLSSMSHDIRTPMNAIVGMTTIATFNKDNPEILQDCLRKITLSSKHLLGLINDVLDMSKIESGKLTLSMTQISLRDTFESITNIIVPQIREKKQHFDITIQNVLAEDVVCDDVRLNQVLINLLSNAVKFTPDEGSIRVSLTQEASPRGDNYVRTHIRVKDTGIGMSEEFKAKIFDSFSREDSARVHRTEGSGLGMAITKYIIDEMKGTIEVESEQGKGSEFHVTLDLEKAQIEEKDMTLPEWDMLVVDDDDMMCKSAVDSLKEIGVSAEYATDGETAISMAVKRHEEKRDYHIILLDWKMPDLNGIETAKRLREEIGIDAPILMISAYDWSDIEEEAKSAGINGFISKPLFKSTLYHSLSAYMNVMDETQESAGEQQSAEETQSRKVLVAEDYDMNWEILETLLPGYGYEVERAENGQICVDKFMASEVGYYSIILMDLRMPVMNGYDATVAIRGSGREDAKCPIIAMTADAFSDDVHRCLECGMNAHVAKPIDMRELLAEMEKNL